MKRRLFIALNLPDELKTAVEWEVEKIRYSFTDDVRFMDREQWHVTVTFLGYQPDEAVPPIIRAMKAAGTAFKAPEIAFTDITYGPKNATPRMIWLNGSIGSSQALQPIKDTFENALVDNGIVFKREHRRLSIHITLARFMSHENLPELHIPFTKTVSIPTLDLMESHLARTGAKYEFLQKIKFRYDKWIP